MITEEQARRVLEVLPQVTDMEAEMAETIVWLYESQDRWRAAWEAAMRRLRRLSDG